MGTPARFAWATRLAASVKEEPALPRYWREGRHLRKRSTALVAAPGAIDAPHPVVR